MPGDDYMFMMKMPKDGSVGMNRISSVSDFIESQINIYYTCHYRILVHTLIQFFVLLPAWVFDLINTFVFLFIIRLIIPEKGHVLQFPKLYLAVLLFVWIFHPDLANAYFWTTGAFNYSWTLIPLLLFVRKLVDYIDNNKGTRMLFYLSPLVASCNENALISLFAVISLLLVYSYFKRKTFDVYLLLTLIILLIGGFLMIFSPSATARIGRDAMAFQSLGWRVLEFIKRSAFYLLLYSPILFLPLLFKFKNFAIGKSTPWLMLIILLSILSMFAAPIFEIRSSIFGFFLSIYLMLYLLKGSKSIIPIVFVFLIFYGIRFGVERGRDFYKVNQSVKSNIENGYGIFGGFQRDELEILF